MSELHSKLSENFMCYCFVKIVQSIYKQQVIARNVSIISKMLVNQFWNTTYKHNYLINYAFGER